MALAKHKAEWAAEAGTPRQGGEMRLGQPVPSPARALQQLLDERTAPQPEVDRWSRRRALAFIVASTCALWITILELATHAVRAVA